MNQPQKSTFQQPSQQQHSLQQQQQHASQHTTQQQQQHNIQQQATSQHHSHQQQQLSQQMNQHLQQNSQQQKPQQQYQQRQQQQNQSPQQQQRFQHQQPQHLQQQQHQQPQHLQQQQQQQQQQPQHLQQQQQPQQQHRIQQPSPPNENKNELQLKKDRGVQVDWTIFAEADNHDIKAMFAQNVESKESETAESKEIRMYRQREFNLLGHLNDYRKRTEDLKRKISLREMQLERLECELSKHKEFLVEAKGKERELQYLISDLRLTIEDLNEKYKEEAVLSKLRDAEHGELVDQLRNHIQKGNSRIVKKSEKNRKTKSSRANHQSIDFLAATDDFLKPTSNGSIKLSASLGSISPTRKTFSVRPSSRRRSDDNGKFATAQDFGYGFESDSENEIPSDLSSSSDGLRPHSRPIRNKSGQRKSHSKRRHTAAEELIAIPTLGNGSSPGKSVTNHPSRSPNVNQHRRQPQEHQNLVPLQHSPQRHRGSTTLSVDERRNLLLSTFAQDMP